MKIKETDFKAKQRLDCCGHLCPVPILMTEEKMEDLRAGDILEVLYTDIGAKADLGAWCRATGHALLFIRENGRVSFAYIRKADIPK